MVGSQLCSLSKDELRKRGFRHVLSYIRWGEREEFHKRSTVQARAAGGNLWYDLTKERRPDLILPKLQQYRHIIALNPEHYFCNSSLLEVFTEDIASEVLCAILNSTLVALAKQFFARMHGREGSLQLDVYSAQMMLVPDARRVDKVMAKHLRSVLASMRKRKALALVDVDGTSDEWSGELAFDDRQELDDAVLELLGITSSRERKALRAELYAEMTRLYREIRETEKKMQKFRAATARRGRPSPQSLADEIWETFNEKPIAKALAQFVPAQAKTEAVVLPQGKARSMLADMFNPNSLQFGKQFVPLGSPEGVQYGLQLSEDGVSGQVQIPVDPTVCKRALREYREYIERLSNIFTEAAAGYTADEQMRERIVRELWKKAGRR